MSAIFKISFFLLMLSLPLVAQGKEVRRPISTSDLYIKYISKNIDLIELSNKNFYQISPEEGHVVSRWHPSDPLSIFFVQESVKRWFGLFEGFDMKGVVLFNKRTNEEVYVHILGIRPAAYTLDQPSYPYLHLKYVEPNWGKDTVLFMLSSGKRLYVSRLESRKMLLSWECSDVLRFKGGIFTGHLYNVTRGEGFEVASPP